ncbi:hypothetical protein [uncultured Thiodictyon sp.]|jgi:hypothetical protein|nr:hypothetical protein [uncultured Thiodictyon sp.]
MKKFSHGDTKTPRKKDSEEMTIEAGGDALWFDRSAAQPMRDVPPAFV